MSQNSFIILDAEKNDNKKKNFLFSIIKRACWYVNLFIYITFINIFTNQLGMKTSQIHFLFLKLINTLNNI